ncbi:MAG: hypothetical protein QOF76_3389 [Solirubrobacteraceae bacterium]|nr:hypothetical protein [Solirubrobacteraceae bacterium]
MALGYWKLACIFAGITARYASGAMADDGFSGDTAREHVRSLAARAREHAQRLSTS